MSRPRRHKLWFDNPDNPSMTALYLERYLNYGLTLEELRSDRPIIGIAQTGSDLSPCNRVHLRLAERVREGIRAAGGIAFEFPVHPIQETGRRPTAALDRNLAYLGLVEILHGYPLDGVVLTTGCDKTTPALIMAAATVDLPAIVLSGGPMLDGWYQGRLAGSGTIIWEKRLQLATGEIDYEEFIEAAAASAPSDGYCNTMGTASTMNCLAEALGMSLTGNAAIPAPYRERGQMAYRTGERIVAMVEEDLRPSEILTRQAIENAIVVNSAIGGSTNAQPHIVAIARHAGVPIEPMDWQTVGYDVPLMVNMQPAGSYLSEGFHRAGGLPVVMKALLDHGRLNGEALTVTGRTMAENLAPFPAPDGEVIKPYEAPIKDKAGFIVLKGNLFDAAIMKTSVISEEFRARYLSRPGAENVFEGPVVVFDGSEDYHHRIEDPALGITPETILVIRYAGPVGWPGSAEVVNMQPPAALIERGVSALPCMGDGRQSGTSGSPSILNASPEAAVGGGLGLLKTGDRIRVDLNAGTADALVDAEEWERRRAAFQPVYPASQTPWQELYRATVGQLADGAVMEMAVKYQKVADSPPRDSH
ncbi:dihydroxy-acid dehydratase [Pleomorphomonas diazotrophica]|uniref:Dihydroxy-acid dehydratase n=1 Tax=Pleomorphomonas diazotrophica TaxID=1166257 RepID=A0A1I4WHU1_9HYPH|nr:IlvD/Edd family dehydratase [Pleomorphomonas diazotrophica]PKR89130.1 dihydroxy-acid dehydratase [Pleomorphomonas diazotrophica]SFN12833.1 dihydroxy-acid dehydratase [Pleomorphomonas diazotrophica]